MSCSLKSHMLSQITNSELLINENDFFCLSVIVLHSLKVRENSEKRFSFLVKTSCEQLKVNVASGNGWFRFKARWCRKRLIFLFCRWMLHNKTTWLIKLSQKLLAWRVAHTNYTSSLFFQFDAWGHFPWNMHGLCRNQGRCVRPPLQKERKTFHYRLEHNSHLLRLKIILQGYKTLHLRIILYIPSSLKICGN